MGKKYKRRKYFIHPSSQLKYIAFSVLPALIMSLFCTYMLIQGGELVLEVAKEKPLIPVYAMKQMINTLEKDGYSKDTAPMAEKLKGQLDMLRNTLEAAYSDTLTQWDRIKRFIFVILFCILFLVGLLSLLYSHKIAGPLFRIKKSIDLLAEGKQIPPIRLRKHDEFKELAESLDKLRNNLDKRGLLKSG